MPLHVLVIYCIILIVFGGVVLVFPLLSSLSRRAPLDRWLSGLKRLPAKEVGTIGAPQVRILSYPLRLGSEVVKRG